MLASCSSNSSTPPTSNIYELNSSAGSLTAASGDVTGTKFQLTFSNMKNEVNWFRDRPIRESGSDTVSNLVANIWPTAYGSVAPNAVLEAFYGTRQYIQIFCTLEKPVYNAATGELSFAITINYLEGNQGAFSNLALEDLQLIILNNAASSSAASTGAEQWSDLLYGDSCTFESAADGSYTLRITNVFSDIYGYTSAPSRNWKKTPVKDYLDTWQARFGNTSPNVAIMSTAANNAFRIQIVTLSSPAYDENTKSVSFTATPVYGTINAGEVLSDIELFIDGSSGVKFTIKNLTNNTIYVYISPSGKTTPYGIMSKKDFQLPVSGISQRIYFAGEKLKNSLEINSVRIPDSFNSSVDQNVAYSFMEYTILDDTYTVNPSYVDEFSYPYTIQFSNVGNYKDCQENFEYGFTSLTTVKNNLISQGAPWDKLIWPNGGFRIIGPNRVWLLCSLGGCNNSDVPQSYKDFNKSLPWDGTTLFNTQQNFSGWKDLVEKDNPGPSQTGYVIALRKGVKADNNSKYGFFTYPRDNSNGQFTSIPHSVGCTITVYPYDK